MAPIDVIVIGGGPAGLSAAARSSWTDALGSPFRARVQLIEPCVTTGGLARWQPLMTYGPQNFFGPRDLDLLRRACKTHGVEATTAAIESIAPCDSGAFAVHTGDGARYEAPAIILATGLRRSFEAEPRLYQQRRLSYTPGSHPDALNAFIAELREVPGLRTLAILGFRRNQELRNAMTPLSRVQLVWIEQGTDSVIDENTIAARVLEVQPAPTGVRLILQRTNSAMTELNADALVLDSASLVRECSTSGCAVSLGLRMAAGFIVTDKQMQTSVPGVFAAGDVAGPPFSVAKALAEGMIAGFSAFAYVFEKHLGKPPDLFPYFAPP